MSSLGFTSKEQRNLGLLVHLMTSNPKILYAPAGSEADRVILKVRESGTLGLLSPSGAEAEGAGPGASGTPVQTAVCRTVLGGAAELEL